jgi:hypothetical protein
MSAAKVVMEARAAGIRLGVDGDDLLLNAVSAPPAAVRDETAGAISASAI